MRGKPLATYFRCVLICVAAQMVATGGRAQSPSGWPQKKITLLDAVASLLARHPLLQLQQQEVAARRGAFQIVTGQFDPLLNNTLSQSRSHTPLTREQQLPDGNGPASLASNLTSYQAELSEQFRNGISVTPSISGSRTTDQLTNASGVNTFRLSFQVNIPLLRDHGRENVTARERAAEFDVQAALFDLNHNISQLISNAANAYWNAVAAQRMLAIARASEERGRHFLADLRQLVDADKAARADLNQLLANESDRTPGASRPNRAPSMPGRRWP